MIYLRMHDPWHYYYWKSVFAHLPEARLHVSPWAAVKHPNKPLALKRTTDWLSAQGIAHTTGPIGEEATLIGSFNFDHSALEHPTAKKFRLIYAAASKAVQYGEENRRFDLVLATSRFSQRQLESVGAKAAVVGYPKLDDYFTLAYTRQSRDRPIVLYAPTCREMCSIKRFGKAFGELLPDVELWVQPHPATALESPSLLDEMRPYAKILDGAAASPETLYQADLLVTDYSGITAEACAMDRPVVLLDLPEFVGATVHHAVLFRDMGPRVSNPSELAEVVCSELASGGKDYQLMRAHYKQLLFEFQGTAGQRAAEVLGELTKGAN